MILDIESPDTERINFCCFKPPICGNLSVPSGTTIGGKLGCLACLRHSQSWKWGRCLQERKKVFLELGFLPESPSRRKHTQSTTSELALLSVCSSLPESEVLSLESPHLFRFSDLCGPGGAYLMSKDWSGRDIFVVIGSILRSDFVCPKATFFKSPQKVSD